MSRKKCVKNIIVMRQVSADLEASKFIYVVIDTSELCQLCQEKSDNDNGRNKIDGQKVVSGHQRPEDLLLYFEVNICWRVQLGRIEHGT